METEYLITGEVEENAAQEIVAPSGVDFDIEACYSSAKITQTLTFKCKNTSTRSGYFYLPRSISAAYWSLEIFYGNIQVFGTVKLKEDALSSFNAAAQKGQLAVLVDMSNPQAGARRQDCLCVRLANLIPGVEVNVRLGIIQDVVKDVACWKLTIPASITALFRECAFEIEEHPDFSNSMNPFRVVANKDIYPHPSLPTIENPSFQDDHETPQDARNFHSAAKSAYQQTNVKYRLKVFNSGHDYSWDSSEDLQYQGVEISNQAGTGVHKYELRVENQPESPKKDFVFCFCDSNIGQAVFNFMHWPENKQTPYALSIDFDPFANHPQEVQHKVREAATKQKAEFLFLLDRSGSMHGIRIKMAIQSLVIAIRSLPQGSFFNIVSFGSGHKFLFPVSKPADDEWTNQAIEQVLEFEADMGHTRMYKIIREVYSLPQVDGLPRIIFMMTDGKVNSVEHIIRYIEASSTFHRIFTLGIGSDFSEELVQGMARAGNGISVGVQFPQKMTESVIGLLESAFHQASRVENLMFSGLEVEFSDPMEGSVSYLFNKRSLSISALIKEYSPDSKLAITFDTVHPDGTRIEHEIPWSQEHLVKSDLVHKALANRYSTMTYKSAPNSRLRKHGTGNSDLEELGLNNQILNWRTSFLAIVGKQTEPTGSLLRSDSSKRGIPGLKPLQSTSLGPPEPVGSPFVTSPLPSVFYGSGGIGRTDLGLVAGVRKLDQTPALKVQRTTDSEANLCRFKVSSRDPDETIKIDKMIHARMGNTTWEEFFEDFGSRFKLCAQDMVIILENKKISLKTDGNREIQEDFPAQGETPILSISSAGSPLTDESTMMEFIKLQSSDGLWKWTVALKHRLLECRWLIDTNHSDCPTDDITATTFVVRCFEQYLATFKGRWRLLVHKTKKCLQQSFHPYQ